MIKFFKYAVRLQCFTDEGSGKKRSSRIVASSSVLPVPGESSSTVAAVGAGCTSALSSSPSLSLTTTCTCSHTKAYPSLSFKRQLPFVNSPPAAGAEFSKCNGFAQSAASAAPAISVTNGVESLRSPNVAVAEGRPSSHINGTDHRARPSSLKDGGDKSKIPRRIASPSKSAQPADVITNG